MAGLEDAIVESAGGDFGLLIISILIGFILTICGLLVRWMMKTIPEQMQADRIAICDKLGELIGALKSTQECFDKRFDSHDTQARKILDTDTNIATTLNNRPCVAGNIKNG